MSRRAAAAAAMLLFALAAGAQTRPFDRAVREYVWLAGTNPAGLREFRSADISDAALYGGAQTGGFRRSWESPAPWRAGAAARTVKHLDRFSMKGGFSFEQGSGPDMCGSMSLRPGHYPLDVLEFTPGRKTRQTYSFDGSVSVDLGRGWRLGAGMDFTSANCAKRKDLRYTDYLLDMTVTPGVTYSFGSFTLGVDYIFRKDSESIVAEQVGTGESSYYAFLDKGLRYGKYEVWTGSGVHLDEAGVQGFPQKEHFHGIGLQFGYGGYYYADAEFLYGDGSAGEKQSVWYRFPSRNVNVRFAENFSIGGRRVYFREYFSWGLQDCGETVLDKVVSGGVTVTEEYGENRILSRETWSERFEATVARGGFEYTAAFEMASFDAVSSQMYPFVAESERSGGRVSIAPAWFGEKWDFGAGIGYGWGSVTKDLVRLASEDSGALTYPFRLQEYYDADVRYDTVRRADVSVSVRRHLPMGIFLEAEGSYLRAFGADFSGGPFRASGVLTLGWTF